MRKVLQGSVPRVLPLVGPAVTLVAVGWIVVATSQRVALRLGLPYDLLYWPDDYFFTILMKIDAGLSPYSDPADANSWIYSPGGPYLHWLLLAPFGLVRSFVANKILGQVWLVSAIGLGAWAGVQIASQAREFPRGKPERAMFVALVSAILAVAALTNPVADSLHPTNLELAFVSATIGLAARWPFLSLRTRATVGLLGPMLAVAIKQTTGITVATTFAMLALMQQGRFSARVAMAALPGVGMATSLLLLQVSSGGWFWTWCYSMPRNAPWEMWKVRDFTAGMGLWLYPALAVIFARTVRALACRSAPDRAWLRALVPLFIYTPLAVMALLKALGGPNNITVLSFLYAVVVAPALVLKALSGPLLFRHLSCSLLAILTLTAWMPQKRTPNRADFVHGKILCDYFATRTRCGERVLLPRGAACFASTDVRFPIDRAMPEMDVAVAGRALGMTRRLVAQEYDLAMITETDLHSPWLRSALAAPLRAGYVPFAQIGPGQAGDLWLEGWGDFMAGPVTLFERIRDRGTHSVDDAAYQCEAIDARRESMPDGRD